MKVQVIGLGTVGLPTALHISKFFETIGYDVNLEAENRALKHGLCVAHSVITADVYIITVSTGLKPNNEPDMTAIYNVCGKIAGINQNALISIESTVPVGTCRKVAEKFGLRKIAHCPHRFWSEDPENHGVVQTRVLGAINKETLKVAEKFYTRLGIPLCTVSSIEVAEMTKIAENAYRFVQIAFAEELKMICDALGLPFEEVRVACNTKWNIEILEARDGIGGECLPKDIRYLITCKSSAPLLNGAIEADHLYRRYFHGKS